MVKWEILLTESKTKKLSLVHVVYLIFTIFSTLATYSFTNFVYLLVFHIVEKVAPQTKGMGRETVGHSKGDFKCFWIGCTTKK